MKAEEKCTLIVHVYGYLQEPPTVGMVHIKKFSLLIKDNCEYAVHTSCKYTFICLQAYSHE